MMTEPRHCQHISVTINRSPAVVYDYVVNPANLPHWATAFCRSARQAGDRWLIETPDGEFEFRFVDRNNLGVLDHQVTLPNGDSFHNPMRVIANGAGSELTFTLFQPPGMSDENFAKDAGMITADLRTLKSVLETQGSQAK